MTYTLVIALSFSIAIAAIIGGIRYSKINPAYYPFLYCIWLGLLNEIIGYIITQNGYSNAVNNNIYVLLESLLITWQFRKWGLFQRTKTLFFIILASFILIWLTEIFLLSRMKLITSYFRIVYSFTIVLMSIPIINEQLLRERKNLLKNSIFLICIGFVIYYTYKVIIGLFWLYGFSVSREFRTNIIIILIYINFIANLIYAFAVLWMPTKHRFSLPSS